jgi:hypothetical protein
MAVCWSYLGSALPNPRMQRTPSAPLMRNPLGGSKANHVQGAP